MDLSNKRVLIVDDDPQTSAVLKMLLQELGVNENNILSEADGSLGLARFRTEKAEGRIINLVITDTQMPLKDGPTMMRDLRAEGYAGPIIQITGGGCKEPELAPNERFLRKPFMMKEIQSTIELLLSGEDISKPKILIFDDENDSLALVHRLEHEGFDVACASYSEAALKKLNGVDIVISEHKLPNMNGMDFLQICREAPYNFKGPFVINSIYPKDEIVAQTLGQKYKPDIYVVKNGVSELVALVKSQIQERESYGTGYVLKVDEWSPSPGL